MPLLLKGASRGDLRKGLLFMQPRNCHKKKVSKKKSKLNVQKASVSEIVVTLQRSHVPFHDGEHV